MDLDELQSVQSRERQTDSLQQLRESFYCDAGEYITALRNEREQAAERADDPWNSPEISRLSDDIETAEDTVEAIYERRVGKVVKMASLAAAGMPTDDAGLTDEERQLFDSLVADIETSRDRVEAILDGEAPADAASASPGAVEDTPEPTAGATEALSTDSGSDAGDVDVADLMGGNSTGAGAGDSGHRPAEPDGKRESAPGQGTNGDTGAGEADGGESDVERATVRITADVGEIFGVEGRSYDLSAADVVTLPEANVEPLVERGAAERLD